VQIVPKRWSELVRCLEIHDPLACGVHTRLVTFTWVLWTSWLRLRLLRATLPTGGSCIDGNLSCSV
jgi:hypothetical protein